MRYGIFGGAFDPIHFGHLLLAESCLQQTPLDRIFFVPTGISPHRAGKEQYATSAAQRADMVELAIADCPEFSLSRYEIERAAPSYTVETLRFFREHLLHENDELFLLLGADMLHDLPNWREPEEVLRLALPLAVERPGSARVDFSPFVNLMSSDRSEMAQHLVVRMPQMDFSSSQIRATLAVGGRIRFQVPREVEGYIRTHQLYTRANSGK